VAELERLLGAIKIDLNGTRDILKRAARLHDWGKAHPVFQQTLHLEDLDGKRPEPLLAKQNPSQSRRQHSRMGFRHELASALAALAKGEDILTAYLDAAHHGKVRANIRSLEGEKPKSKDLPIARGIQDGDELFAADLGGGERMPEMELSLDPMELGNGGWTDRVLQLLDTYGPFRLAYLELLLRAADERASEKTK
jgi:CRISPR-associated endonuclease/helicase Cas3